MGPACPLPPQLEGKVKLSTGHDHVRQFRWVCGGMPSRMPGSKLAGFMGLQPGKKEQGWKERRHRESPKTQVQPPWTVLGTRDLC